MTSWPHPDFEPPAGSGPARPTNGTPAPRPAVSPPPTQPAGAPVPPAPKRTASGGLVAALIILPLILALGGVAYLALRPQGLSTVPPPKKTVRHTPTGPALTSVSPRPSQPAKTTTYASPRVTPTAPTSVTPVIPGWQGVVDPAEGAAYDVPTGPDWKVEPGAIRGYETRDGDLVTVRTPTVYKEACDRHWERLMAGYTYRVSGTKDEQTSAASMVYKWAYTASVDDNGGQDPFGNLEVAPITLADGTQAWRASMIWRPTGYGACGVNEARISVVALYSPKLDAVLHLVVVADQQHRDAPGRDIEDKILSSFRLV